MRADDPGPVFFYTPAGANGWLSNFAPYGVELDGAWWPSAEHCFQAQKFPPGVQREKIRRARTPRRAADLGRDRSVPIRTDWEEVKDGLMREIVLQKFRTHGEIREKLLVLAGREIVEASPSDYHWGAGADGSGENRLGKILMFVRDELLQEANE